MEYQWYPGHMTKARRRMQENLKLVDLVIELTDARCVLAGRNPDIDRMAAQKSRILVLTKADLADEKANRAWTAYFTSRGILAIAADARERSGIGKVRQLVEKACEEKIARDRSRGIKNRPVRAMIVGIPNVGKSTFINSFAGRASAKTGNKPGVTRGEQWIRPDRTLELLDTPGILWPKFEEQKVGMLLSLTGTIKDELLDHYELAVFLGRYLKERYPGAMAARYGISEEKSIEELLPDIAAKKGLMKSGGEPDTERAQHMLLEDFRTGRLGRISLEFPEEGADA